MEKADILNPDIDLAHLIRHVAKDQISVELSEGSIAIAEVVPKKTGFEDFSGTRGLKCVLYRLSWLG